jgi:hypothetical protein
MIAKSQEAGMVQLHAAEKISLKSLTFPALWHINLRLML